MIKTSEIARMLCGRIINCGNPDREIKGGYSGDFLSFVMGRAPSSCAWFTVMTNVNVCAVATLADVGVIVLCEGVEASEQLLEKAKEHRVNIVATELDTFEAVKKYVTYEN